ncbi:hypothetical protein IWZ03DRAFT_370934 [Phyllosticta citriasiana]|uniref:Uncharacterized protein n=1 Tax=Phyllosticta citriasiana TaxID=595635 RepID=A0ABR1KVY0_9PEZI
MVWKRTNSLQEEAPIAYIRLLTHVDIVPPCAHPSANQAARFGFVVPHWLPVHQAPTRRLVPCHLSDPAAMAGNRRRGTVGATPLARLPVCCVSLTLSGASMFLAPWAGTGKAAQCCAALRCAALLCAVLALNLVI